MPKIAAGITLYEPEPQRLKENVEAVLKQVERLYIVDNASSDLGEFKAAVRPDERIVLIENSENAGVACALNQMCEAAEGDGYEWLLTLDQDSLTEPDIIEKFCRYTDIPEVAIITPRYVDDNEPQIVSSESPAPYETVKRCDTSASLVRLEVWREVGGFDEAMFIDYVDFDFCTTVIENGYVILRDNEAVLHHRLGRAQEITFFIPIGRVFHIKKLQKPIFTYNHSPFRTYYFVRNAIYYRYKHRGSIDARHERRAVIRWVLLKLMFEKQKTAQLRAALRGKRDSKKMIEKYSAGQKKPGAE